MADTSGTAAVLAEWADPSVVSHTGFRAALRAFQPVLNRLSAQAACLQALAGVAELDETRPGVRQKFTGLNEALRGVQMKHDRALELLQDVTRAAERLEREMGELRREHEREASA